jgi:hypothetical protein
MIQIFCNKHLCRNENVYQKSVCYEMSDGFPIVQGEGYSVLCL